jgi:hypothetical protein
VTHDCNHYVKRYDPRLDASKKNRAPPKDLWKISVNKRYGKNSRTYGKEKIPSYDIIWLWYHSFISMISVTYDIIDLWYHSQYHTPHHIWYHGIETMIS